MKRITYRGSYVQRAGGNAETFAIIPPYEVISELLIRKPNRSWRVVSNGMAHVTVLQVRKLPYLMRLKIARSSANQGGTAKITPFVPSSGSMLPVVDGRGFLRAWLTTCFIDD